MRRLNYHQAAAALERKRVTLQREIVTAETQAVNETQQMFVRASSGTVSTKHLRLMGHPYAIRDPQTPLNPAVINDQGGDFARKWQKVAPRLLGGVLRSRVVNTSQVAKYMFGTKLMVTRPIDKAVAVAMQSRRLLLHRRALRRGLSA